MKTCWHILVVLVLFSGDSSSQCLPKGTLAAFENCFHTRGPSVIKIVDIPEYGCLSVQCANGWLVWLRRKDGQQPFARPWQDYKVGFGDAYGEFWLGLDLLHNITSSHKFQLKIERSDDKGGYDFAQYSSFAVKGEEDNYELLLSGYDEKSTTGQVLLDGTILQPNQDSRVKMAFSTYDRDNDNYGGQHCSRANGRGGWWFSRCHKIYPTGQYTTGKTSETTDESKTKRTQSKLSNFSSRFRSRTKRAPWWESGFKSNSFRFKTVTYMMKP